MAARAWEGQSRGVGHFHVVVPYGTLSQKRRADAYVLALKELAPRYWFGFVDASRRMSERGGRRAAGYVAKAAEYVAKGHDQADEINRPFYCSRELTRSTGMTMRMMRLRRYAWHVLDRHDLTWEDIDADPDEPWTWLPTFWGQLANPPPLLCPVEST